MPSAGGPAWTELTSEHFLVYTDASVARGHEIVREMEHLRQVVLGVAFPRAEVGGKIFVVAFRNSAEVAAFVPKQFNAMAFEGDGGIYQPMIVVNANADEDDRETLTHELTHVISFGAIAHQPRWFGEGLASFFETTSLAYDRTLVDVGMAQQGRMYVLQHEGPLSMAEVFACKSHACMGDRFYSTVWLLYSFLMNVHPQELARLQVRLAEGTDAERVWSEVFPSLPPGKLDHEMAAWISHGQHQIWHFTAKIVEPHITTRPIGDAEVQTARGVLRAYIDNDGTTEPPEIAAALQLDPTSVLAMLIRSWKLKKVELDAAEATVAAHADDWRAYLLLGWAATTRTAQLEAYAQACKLAPNPILIPRDVCGAQ